MLKVNRKKLSLAVLQALGTGVMVGAVMPVANAQQTTPAPATTAAAEDVQRFSTTVTGSRIPSANLTSTSPVTTVGAQDIKLEGVQNVENLLNNLPQVFADFGQSESNGATGTATVNLRNLGAQRTLVLVNGRRLPAGSPTYYPTDLNQIPAPLIERVEILTGGASAVYGSDAVAGVVNFIMKDNFQGLQIDGNWSAYNHQQNNSLASVIQARAATNPSQFAVPGDVSHDGESYNLAITMGSNFANNRGNATLFFQYQKTHAVLQRDRDYSACATGDSADGNSLVCSGSGTSYPGQFFDVNAGVARTIADSAGNVRPYTSNDQFNFAPYNYYQRPDERYGFNAFAHYDVNDHARVYGEFSFTDDHTDALIAPSGVFGLEFALADTNPLLSPGFKSAFGITPTTPGDVVILRRNQEGGGRDDDRRHTSFRGVLGVKGDVFDGKWDYDVFAQSGKVLYQETYRNDFSKIRIGRALDVVNDPATGQPVCASVLDGSDPGCVPYDIFHLGGVTQGALAYLQTPGLQRGSTQQEVQGATLSSDLGQYGWKLPWAKSGVGVAFGLERRVEKLALDTDTEFSTFDLAGQGGPTIGLSGQFTVKEAFAEVRVPIVEGAPWADLLSFNGSYRYSDYSTGHTTNSYGLGVEWAPVKAVRLRGSYQQSVRAPNVIELFTAQGLNLLGLSSDPCGANPTATLAQCQRTGITAAQYGGALITNPAGQYNYLQGGNPLLTPETGKSTTLGFVLTPMRDMSASVDYFQIKGENQVGIVPPATTLTQCLNAGAFCDLIHRDALGTLWLTGFISGLNQNLASAKTSGFDFSFNYIYPMQNRWGSLAFSFLGTWLKEFKQTPVPGLGEYDCAGLYGPVCGAPLPEWRHKARVTWQTPWNTDLALTWRHIDKVTLDSTSSDPNLNAPFAPVDRELGERDYLDLAASWNVTKQLTISGGIDNLLDKDPPIVSSSIATPAFGNGNTYPQVYDSLGRHLFIGLQYRF
jgi:outer membrane receptor protein involved in Fe transport